MPPAKRAKKAVKRPVKKAGVTERTVPVQEFRDQGKITMQHIYPDKPTTVKFERNTRGVNWEVSASSVDSEEALEIAIDLAERAEAAASKLVVLAAI